MADPLFDTTPRRVKFLKTYKETNDPEYAAAKAWPELPERRRTRIMKAVMTEPQVRNAATQAGLGVPKLMKKHAELLNAKKLISINGLVEEVDNHEVQMKALETGYKLHKILTPLSNDAPQTNNTLNINVDPTKLAEITRRLEEVNRKMLPLRAVDAVDVG